MTSKKITYRYIVHQTLYFMYLAGVSAFATTYLLAKGFDASKVGTILALSGLLSCLVQPLVGDVADRLKKFILPQLITALFVASFICFSIIHFLQPSLIVFGALYCVALFLPGLSNSLNNSLCAYYTNHGYQVNYGAGQGAGSLSFSIASLAFGYIIAWFGVDSMMSVSLVLNVMLIIVILKYPKLPDREIDVKNVEEGSFEERVSIIEFFGKYKRYVCTLVGVMLCAMCHVMIENYFIEIFKNIGGGSEHVGIALFVACTTAVPYFFLFERMRKKVGIHIFLRMGGVFFMLKALLLLFATQIWHVYLIQLLQLFTYGFIHQPLYYLARARVSKADLVKGQAVSVSMYLLGTAAGNYFGGVTIEYWGVKFMLMLALVIATTGAVIINLTLGKEHETGII